jgi:hypothetical protein
MLSKTGKLRRGYEEITPPHLALMKVEIQAKGWFFLCSLDLFGSFCSDGKKNKTNPKLQTSGVNL